MSERAKIREEKAKTGAQIVPERGILTKPVYESRESFLRGSLERVDSFRRDGTQRSLLDNGLPDGLSFLSISRGSKTYPDTAESGETYEVEVSIPAKTTRIIAPIGEYSE